MKKNFLADLVRLVAHSKLLQKVVLQQYQILLEQTEAMRGSKLSCEDQESNSTLSINCRSAFFKTLYEDVWAEIMEEEIWNENSPLSIQANDALPNSRSPYGYRFTYRANRPTLSIHIIESQIVRLIYSWYLEFGMTLRDITEALSELNLPTPYNIHHKGKENTQENWGQWNTGAVHRILTSSTYYGDWIYHDSYLNKRTLIHVPPIIEQEQYDLVRARLLENLNTKGVIVERYPYPNRIQCDHCGSKTRSVKKAKFYYCRCITKNCSTRGFLLEQINAIVLEWLFQRCASSENDVHDLMLAYQEQCTREIEEVNCSIQILDSYSREYKQQLKHLSQFIVNDDMIVAAQQRYESELQYALSAWQEKRKQLVKKKQELKSISHNFTLKFINNDFPTQKRVMKAINMQIWIKGRNKERSLKIKCSFGEAMLPYI